MKKLMFAIALVALVAAGCNKAANNNQSEDNSQQNQTQSAVPTPMPTPTPTPTPTSSSSGSQPHFSDGSEMEVVPAPEVREIDMTANGFSPSTITIHKNDYVVFVNKDTSPHWPASNPHPIHTDLPGFDAKKGLAQGEKYQYQFTKLGSWGFHDHLNPSSGGTVIVQ